MSQIDCTRNIENHIDLNRSLLKNSNFILHWLSVCITQIGNFFTIVAIPWLVLYLTDDNPVAMTGVFAIINLPQGFFILFGGALADRFSPKRMLIAVRFTFFLVMLALTSLVLFKMLPLWLLFIFGFTLGTLGGFSHPAAQSLLPTIIDQSKLTQANGIVMSTLQITQAVAPLLVGWLIWLGRRWGGIPDGEVDFNSIAFAFAIDACSVLLAGFLTLYIRTNSIAQPTQNLSQLLKEGFTYIWKSSGIRVVLLYVFITSFFLHGPLHSSIPFFTKSHLSLGEVEFGGLFGALGFGTIIGATLAMTLLNNNKNIGRIILTCDLIIGVNMTLLSLANSFFIAALHLILIGLCGGIIMVKGTTWIQKRTPGKLMGRVMGILMFCVMGFVPVSGLLMGYLIDTITISNAFLIFGFAIVLCSTGGFLIKEIRNLSESKAVSYDQ